VWREHGIRSDVVVRIFNSPFGMAFGDVDYSG
jgi:hypothetical protein